MVEETITKNNMLHSPPKSPKLSPTSPGTKRPATKNTQPLSSRVSNANQKQGQRKEQSFTKRGPGSPEKEPKHYTYNVQGSPEKEPKHYSYRAQGSPEEELKHYTYCAQGSPEKEPKHYTYRAQGSPEKEPKHYTYRAQGSPEKEPKHYSYRAQVSPPKDVKTKYSPKPVPKEKTAKAEKIFRLHSEERAVRRASFDSMMASKINSLEIIRRFEEKIMKVIEEEEIKVMRKEMVPKAQLMPFFDKPFSPQRSRRPLTVPKEPSFLKQKCCIGGEFHRHFCFNTKAIR